MAIYTPRGLKIRISVPDAFGLIARLYPEVSAFKILKTTEGIDSLTSVATFIAALICFIMHLDPSQIVLTISITYIAAILINAFGLFIIPGQVALGTLYSYISGYGLFITTIIIIGYITTGWQGLAAYFIAKGIGWCVARVIEFIEVKRTFKLSGIAFTASERCFFNAYRIHANKLGKTTNIDLSEEEMEEEYWKPAFVDFATNWPQVVERFTVN